jgi:hypothetical protein
MTIKVAMIGLVVIAEETIITRGLTCLFSVLGLFLVFSCNGIEVA